MAAIELSEGIFIDRNCTKIRNFDYGGIFIPFDIEWGKDLKELKAYLAKYYPDAKERFPTMFEDRLFADDKIEHIRRLKAEGKWPPKGLQDCS